MPITPNAQAIAQAQVPAVANVDLASLVANATVGVSRNPDLPLGTDIYEIVGTNKPGLTTALVADVVSTTTGKTHRWFRPLTGSPKAISAGSAEALSFIVAAAGYRNLKQFGADYDNAQRQAFVALCMGSGPGPLEGRKVQITVTDTGLKTNPKQRQDGSMSESYDIHRYAFAPIEDTEE
jgi:hypothetical protein